MTYPVIQWHIQPFNDISSYLVEVPEFFENSTVNPVPLLLSLTFKQIKTKYLSKDNLCW